MFDFSVRRGEENAYMDRASLEEQLGQGLSLAEIGTRFQLHESTVGYWVQKHGLEAVNRERYAAKGGLSRRELEPLVTAGMSIAQIAEAVGRGKATVRHWLGKYGLRTNGPRGPGSRQGVREARDAGLSRAEIVCPHHGVAEHVREPRGYYRCCQCRQQAVVRRRRRAKEQLVNELGGRCRLCGYHRCLAHSISITSIRT